MGPREFPIMRYPLPLVALLLAALPLAVASAATPGALRPLNQEDQGLDAAAIKAILAEIRSDKDGARRDLFHRLGRDKTPESFKALQTSVKWLKEPFSLYQAYFCFSYWREDAGLADDAMEFLRDEALLARRETARIQATRVLLLFGEDAHDHLRAVLESGKDEEARSMALSPLLDSLAEAGDVESLELLLGNLSQYDSFELGKRLDNFGGPACREVMLRFLEDRQTRVRVRVRLVERLASEPGDDIDQAFQELLFSRDPEVQIAAIDALNRRDTAEAVRTQLWRMLSSKDENVRMAAIEALGRTQFGDPKWVEKLFALATKRDPIGRIGATTGLAALRTGEAVDLLHGMLSDDDWRVRVAALRNVVALRKRESLPYLIERLEVEEGRVRLDLASALQQLTGLRLGHRPERWRKFWDEEASTFQPPPLEDSLLGDESAAKALEAASVASFYGLPVYSNRITFVLDTSGSMRAQAQGLHDSGGNSTRLAVAKAQLFDLLERIPDGHRLNLIFFDNGVEAWKRRVETIDAKKRKKLVDFIVEQQAGGATNLYDALVLALEDDLTDSVYVLSDGEPTVGGIVHAGGIREQILRLNRRNRVQFYCISIGLISDLLYELAYDTGGRAVEVGVQAEAAYAYAYRKGLEADLQPREYARAQQWARFACNEEEKIGRYQFALGLTLVRLGRYEEAQEALALADEHVERNQTTVRLLLPLARILCLIGQGKHEEARKLAETHGPRVENNRAPAIRAFFQEVESAL